MSTRKTISVNEKCIYLRSWQMDLFILNLKMLAIAHLNCGQMKTERRRERLLKLVRKTLRRCR